MRVAVVVMLLATLWCGVQSTVIEIVALGLFKAALINSGVLTGTGIVLPEILTHLLGKRSIHDPAREADENLLLSAVSQLDSNGCVLKLLCLLEAKTAVARTQEEEAVVDMFNNQTDSVTAYNAPFVLAADLGAKGHDAALCDKYFSKCALSEAKLSSFLQQSWSCDMDQ